MARLSFLLFPLGRKLEENEDEINACSRKWIITGDNLDPYRGVYHRLREKLRLERESRSRES